MRLVKSLLVVVSLSYFSPLAFACDTAKMETMNDNVTRLIKWYNQIGDSKNALTQQDTAKYFSPTYRQYTNGKLVATDVDTLTKRLEVVREEYDSAKIQTPVKDVLIDDNKAAVRYVISLKNHNGTKNLNDIVILTFNHEGKVSESWELVEGGDPVKAIKVSRG